MKSGTINGASFLESDIGRIVISSADEASPGRPSSISVALQTPAGTQWTTTIEDLSGDPRRIHSSSDREDLAGIVWNEAGLVALAGYSKLVLLEGKSGTVVRTAKLAFVGKASLDVLTLALSPERKKLLAVSTRRLLVFDSAGRELVDYAPEGSLTAAGVADEHRIWVKEYDVSDPALRIVERTLPVK